VNKDSPILLFKLIAKEEEEREQEQEEELID